MDSIDIEINDIEHEKIIIPRKNYYCSNCNKKGHTFKNCNEPIISNGIIAICIKNFNKNLIPLLEEYINNNINHIANTRQLYKFNQNKLNNHEIENKKICAYQLNKDIKFLMIQRKNSLGYIEFIRGRYNLNDINHVIYLLEQTNPNELNNIINNDFDILWNNLWDVNNIKNKNHHKEYIVSKQKFYELKMYHMELLKNIVPKFQFNEWGFPKGRREMYESDIVCAMREFEEETTINEKKYNVLQNCNYIKENLVGTNGINYAHNYFLALITNKDIEDIDLHNINNTNINNREIGSIKIMNVNECLDIIRPYHYNKIKIIKNIYFTIDNFLKNFESSK